MRRSSPPLDRPVGRRRRRCRAPAPRRGRRRDRQDPAARRDRRPGRRPAAASCCARAATRPSGPCSCSPTSTRCVRSCSALGAAELAELLREHTAAWVAAAPRARSGSSRSSPEPAAAPAIERRRAYDAVVAVLAGSRGAGRCCSPSTTSRTAGAATVDLLGLPGRAALAGAGVLLVGAVRTEDEATRRPARRPRRPGCASARCPRRRWRRSPRRPGCPRTPTRCWPARPGTRSASWSTSARSPPATPGCRSPSPRRSRRAWTGWTRRHATLRPGRRRCCAAGWTRGCWPTLVGADELSAVRLCEELARVGLLHRVGDALRVRQRPGPGVRLRARCHRRCPRRTTAGRPTCSATSPSRWPSTPSRRASSTAPRTAGCSRARPRWGARPSRTRSGCSTGRWPRRRTPRCAPGCCWRAPGPTRPPRRTPPRWPTSTRR